jgi:hypothetical protein
VFSKSNVLPLLWIPTPNALFEFYLTCSLIVRHGTSPSGRTTPRKPGVVVTYDDNNKMAKGFSNYKDKNLSRLTFPGLENILHTLKLEQPPSNAG